MMAPARHAASIVAFGDSITDGTASTHERRRPLAGRAVAAAARGPRQRVAVVNAGIGGNQVAGPAEYSPQKPFPGGPSAGQRASSATCSSLSGVTAMIWLEGINDFSRNGNAALETGADTACSEVVARIRARKPRHPRVRRDGDDRRSAATNAAHGSAEQDEKRKALNEFIRTSGVFDGVVDFDRATLDPATGGMREEFVPTARPAGPATSCTPTARAMRRWERPSTSRC